MQTCVVKPLQMIQNAAARLVFNQQKRAHVTPLLIDLHWLPVAARVKFKSLMLAYRVLAGSAPTYLNALVRANGCCALLVSVVWHCRLCKHLLLYFLCKVVFIVKPGSIARSLTILSLWTKASAK